MLFDVQAALAEVLAEVSAPPAATPATPATRPPRVAEVAGVAGERGHDARHALPASLAMAEADPPGRYGFAVNSNPRTWTGRIVCLDEWRRLSNWERHGSTGKLWNGITRQWEAAQ